jgi:c-di-GMP-binding flagellar brake protein YcgR
VRTDTAEQVGIARALLQQACARNLSGEIHCESAHQRSTARMRFLNVDENRVYTDRPQSIETPVSFRAHQRVAVYFLANGTRYAFRTRVATPLVLVRLNDEQQVVGMALRFPTEVREEQRRSAYRVTVAGQMIQVHLHEVNRDDSTWCPVGADRFTGQLANISAGGVCLLVESNERARFQFGDTFCLQFVLRDFPEPFVLPADVRHATPIHNGQVVRVGLCFLWCDLFDTRSQVVRISRFVAAEQRRQLRRRR